MMKFMPAVLAATASVVEGARLRGTHHSRHLHVLGVDAAQTKGIQVHLAVGEDAEGATLARIAELNQAVWAGSASDAATRRELLAKYYGLPTSTTQVFEIMRPWGLSALRRPVKFHITV